MIKRELKTRTSARIQMTTWIRFVGDDKEGQERVELAFNSLMTSVYRGSEPDQIVDGMIDNMSSYLPLPDWLARKKAIINPHNNDEECFKWAVITAENVGMKDPQRVSNLRKFTDNCDWSGLKFPVSTKNIGVFETNNNVLVNILAVETFTFTEKAGGWVEKLICC